jgi:hypothetical protein
MNPRLALDSISEKEKPLKKLSNDRHHLELQRGGYERT